MHGPGYHYLSRSQPFKQFSSHLKSIVRRYTVSIHWVQDWKRARMTSAVGDATSGSPSMKACLIGIDARCWFRSTTVPPRLSALALQDLYSLLEFRKVAGSRPSSVLCRGSRLRSAPKKNHHPWQFFRDLNLKHLFRNKSQT